MLDACANVDTAQIVLSIIRVSNSLRDPAVHAMPLDADPEPPFVANSDATTTWLRERFQTRL